MKSGDVLLSRTRRHHHEGVLPFQDAPDGVLLVTPSASCSGENTPLMFFQQHRLASRTRSSHENERSRNAPEGLEPHGIERFLELLIARPDLLPRDIECELSHFGEAKGPPRGDPVVGVQRKRVTRRWRGRAQLAVVPSPFRAASKCERVGIILSCVSTLTCYYYSLRWLFISASAAATVSSTSREEARRPAAVVADSRHPRRRPI